MRRRHPRWTRWICLGIALLAAGVWPVAARSARRPSPLKPRSVQVRYGDSLWTLAREYGDPRQDVRAVIHRLQEANRLQAGPLQPGRWLCLPADCLPPPVQ